MAALSWFERKVAATLFAIPPSATNEDAIRHFTEAEVQYPGQWKENKLYLAKAYISNHDYSAGIKWLDEATQLPVSSISVSYTKQTVLFWQGLLRGEG